MHIAAACGCGKTFRVSAEHAGKCTKCPACGASLTIPRPEPTEPPSKAAPAPHDPAVTLRELRRLHHLHQAVVERRGELGSKTKTAGCASGCGFGFLGLCLGGIVAQIVISDPRTAQDTRAALICLGILVGTAGGGVPVTIQLCERAGDGSRTPRRSWRRPPPRSRRRTRRSPLPWAGRPGCARPGPWPTCSLRWNRGRPRSRRNPGGHRRRDPLPGTYRKAMSPRRNRCSRRRRLRKRTPTGRSTPLSPGVSTSNAEHRRLPVARDGQVLDDGGDGAGAGAAGQTPRGPKRGSASSGP